MSTSIIKIAIVDDHALFRSGIAKLMSEFNQIEVVFQAEDGESMKGKLNSEDLPEVMLMDINMAPMDGYQSTMWLKQHYPAIKVLALSMYEDEQAILKMIKVGAGGYILKGAMPMQLLEAIIGIAEKGFYMNDLVSGRMIRSFQNQGKEDKEVNLTPKETEFLKLCASELTYKEIAYKMDISPRTVDSYREILFQKLNLKSRVGLALFAVRNEHL
jgi:DNA-binding NarL/FixJ family response regulator